MLQLLSHLLQEIVKKCSATLVWHFVSWGACLSTNQLYKKCSQMVAVYQSMTVPPAVHDCALPVYQSMTVPYQSTSPWSCPTSLPVHDCALPSHDCALPIHDCALPVHDCALPVAYIHRIYNTLNHPFELWSKYSNLNYGLLTAVSKVFIAWNSLIAACSHVYIKECTTVGILAPFSQWWFVDDVLFYFARHIGLQWSQ